MLPYSNALNMPSLIGLGVFAEINKLKQYAKTLWSICLIINLSLQEELKQTSSLKPYRNLSITLIFNKNRRPGPFYIII